VQRCPKIALVSTTAWRLCNALRFWGESTREVEKSVKLSLGDF